MNDPSSRLTSAIADRYRIERELTANLQHPHILPLFDSGSADGLLYYVMPYVDSETLRGRLDRCVYCARDMTQRTCDS